MRPPEGLDRLSLEARFGVPVSGRVVIAFQRAGEAAREYHPAAPLINTVNLLSGVVVAGRDLVTRIVDEARIGKALRIGCDLQDMGNKEYEGDKGFSHEALAAIKAGIMKAQELGSRQMQLPCIFEALGRSNGLSQDVLGFIGVTNQTLERGLLMKKE